MVGTVGQRPPVVAPTLAGRRSPYGWETAGLTTSGRRLARCWPPNSWVHVVGPTLARSPHAIGWDNIGGHVRFHYRHSTSALGWHADIGPTSGCRPNPDQLFSDIIINCQRWPDVGRSANHRLATSARCRLANRWPKRRGCCETTVCQRGHPTSATRHGQTLAQCHTVNWVEKTDSHPHDNKNLTRCRRRGVELVLASAAAELLIFRCLLSDLYKT